MQKKILTVLLACSILSWWSGAQDVDPVLQRYRVAGAPLPELKIIDTAGRIFTEKELLNGHPLFLVLFNPTCGHCIDMAKMINDSIHCFPGNNIAFLAGAQMTSYLKHFYQATGLGIHTQTTVGVDSAQVLERLYEYKELPQINVYDDSGRLAHTFYGAVPLDSLKRYVK